MCSRGRREATGATEAIADPRAIRAAEATVAARVLLPVMVELAAVRTARRAMVKAAVVDIHPAVAVADARPVAVAAAVAAAAAAVIRLVAIAKAGIG